MSETRPSSVLFICLGNICRSPLAEGVMTEILRENGRDNGIVIDSAGTNGYHTGEPPDRRSIAVAAKYGIDISAQRCRQLVAADFTKFDLILGMDRRNLDAITQRRPSDSKARIGMFSLISLGREIEIPDPYYGGPEDFEHVYRMILAASKAFAERF
ncbi:low molecular weight phosphotyrosine protein phosphatase [Phyllobacterium salinisoli]|uniref:protein-tyrosine-phosphatase n=1 Tax=Phyllobacterium salinisoli TaxID=1899321 RepID=A0A368K9Y2_9HYPH|nr:low molecular weight protein-tyrosine-phosphatase [Phyllobacterium salinisoli]RCS25222.1 low molecular weight phosphotyrosine protein phosphatase [Phyllobacterium salinisoli]